MTDSVVLIQFLIIRIMRDFARSSPEHLIYHRISLQTKSSSSNLSLISSPVWDRWRQEGDFNPDQMSVNYLLDGWFRVFKNRSVES